MKKIRLLLPLVGLMLVASCSSAPRERVIPADGSASSFILNRAEYGFTIYIVNSATRYRLGFVDAMRSGRFKIPGEVVSTGGVFQLVAEGRGGAHGDGLSEPFQVKPGDIVNWRIPDNSLYVR